MKFLPFLMDLAPIEITIEEEIAEENPPVAAGILALVLAVAAVVLVIKNIRKNKK